MIVIHKTESKAVVNQLQDPFIDTRSVNTEQNEKKIFVTYSSRIMSITDEEISALVF